MILCKKKVNGGIEMELTHLDEKGAAHMVDVGGKEISDREAVAQAVVTMKAETLTLITTGSMPKGDVFSCARIAGIMAAKKTHELIPMCHPIPIEGIDIEITIEYPNKIRILAKVKCSYVTGIEMEALTAASIAALTIYDMCKAVDKAMEIGDIVLLKKSGGKSGSFVRS